MEMNTSGYHSIFQLYYSSIDRIISQLLTFVDGSLLPATSVSELFTTLHLTTEYYILVIFDKFHFKLGSAVMLDW